MSFGIQPVNGKKILTKKALKEAVAELGAANVFVFDTAFTGGRGTIPASELRPSDVIVGPDVYNRRDWYANVKVNAKTGKHEVK